MIAPATVSGHKTPRPPTAAAAASTRLFASRSLRERAHAVPLLIGGAEHEARSGRAALFPQPEAEYVAGVNAFFGSDGPLVLERYPPDGYADPFYASADVIGGTSAAFGTDVTSPYWEIIGFDCLAPQVGLDASSAASANEPSTTQTVADRRSRRVRLRAPTR